MKRKGVILVLAILLLFLVYWFWQRKEAAPELSDEDRRALLEDSAESDNSNPQDVPVFPNTPVGNRLTDHMMILAMPAETIEEAEAKYNESIVELKKNSDEAISLLNDAFKKIDASHYFNRWGIVKTLGDLESSKATEILSDIALSKIPDETSQDLHHFSSQEEEVIIRIRAVEGLGKLAKNGDEKADAVLLRLALDSANMNSAIQLRAIKAYLNAGKNLDERTRFLKSRLKEDLHEIITLSVTPPEEFINKMEGINTLSDTITKTDNAERPSSPETPPEVRPN